MSTVLSLHGVASGGQPTDLRSLLHLLQRAAGLCKGPGATAHPLAMGLLRQLSPKDLLGHQQGLGSRSAEGRLGVCSTYEAGRKLRSLPHGWTGNSRAASNSR